MADVACGARGQVHRVPLPAKASMRRPRPDSGYVPERLNVTSIRQLVGRCRVGPGLQKAAHVTQGQVNRRDLMISLVNLAPKTDCAISREMGRSHPAPVVAVVRTVSPCSRLHR